MNENSDLTVFDLFYLSYLISSRHKAELAESEQKIRTELESYTEGKQLEMKQEAKDLVYAELTYRFGSMENGQVVNRLHQLKAILLHENENFKNAIARAQESKRP